MSTDTQEVVKASKKIKFPDIELNRLVSEPLKVKELGENETAVYKLLMADMKDVSRKDSNDNPLNCSPGRSLYHSVKIYDPISKAMVTIRNIASYGMQPVPDGGEKKVPNLKRFIFPKGGTVTIQADQVDTYAFLERHPGNRDNPFRREKDKRRPLFYRVNPIKKAIRDMENDFILVDALNYVRDAKMDMIKTIYEHMSPTAKKLVNASSPETLKVGVFNYAKNNPILAMKASDNKEVKLKIQIMEAEHFNILMFNEGDDLGSKRGWNFVDKDMTAICEVDVAEHKIDGIVKYFSTPEGYKKYQWMTQLLMKVLNPR